MKKILFLVFVSLLVSCTTERKSCSRLRNNELSTTRKYIGNFIDYYHTEPEFLGGTNLIWIRTTLYNTFGKISAYGKTCEFSPGDKLYLKTTYSTPGVFGNWEFQIENDSAVYYRVSNYRYENNVLVLAMF